MNGQKKKETEKEKKHEPKGVSMITSKSKATETDCRSLLVYITLLCDCTRITWTLAFEGDLQNATACASRGTQV